MKILKYISIGLLLVLGVVFAPAIGTCGALGFCVVAILDRIGLIQIGSDKNIKTIIIISIVIGAVLFIIYYAVTGQFS